MNQFPLLNAVNGCLAGIGQSPVDSLDDPDLDAAMALQAVQRASLEVQSRGWWFNREENWELRPNNKTGYLSAPRHTISIIPDERESTRYMQLALRGSRLYDVDKHTYDLNHLLDSKGVLRLSFIMGLDFEELPPMAQGAIATMAKRMFAQDMEVDPQRWQFQREDEDRAMAGLFREDGRNNRRNYLRDSPVMRKGFMYGTRCKPF